MTPVCAILYALASWKFFDVRIHEEERTLVYFFGLDYVRYQERVRTGLPFIKGYVQQPALGRNNNASNDISRAEWRNPLT